MSPRAQVVRGNLDRNEQVMAPHPPGLQQRGWNLPLRIAVQRRECKLHITISSQRKAIKQVEQSYLGGLITTDGSSEKDVQRSIGHYLKAF